MPEDLPHEEQTIETEDARQGRGGRRLSAEMVIALVLTIIGFAAVWVMWARPFASVDSAPQKGDVAEFQAPQTPASDVPTPTPPPAVPTN